ncbi:hypothetical protein [Bdellovibrio bacteriovorus]|uniref:hypothetical protein n=1 Tax=Bdellovibrio bacteriovorus TaxID=959 RepID=UPI0035A71C81
MNRVLQLCLIVIFVGLSCSCAFKKDQTQAPNATENKEHPLFQSVLSLSTEKLAPLLSPYQTHELSTLEYNGKTLLETALIRGNGHIIYLLLKAGASPFHKGSASSFKPYELMLTSDLNSALLGSWSLKIYRDMIIQPLPLDKIAKSLKDLGLNCNDILTLDSFMVSTTGQGSQAAVTLIQNQCMQSLTAASKKEAIKRYAVAAIRYAKWDHAYMNSLMSSYEIRTAFLQFTSNGKPLNLGVRALFETALKYLSSEEKKNSISSIIENLPNNTSSEIEYTLDIQGPIKASITRSDSWIAPQLQEQLTLLLRNLENFGTPIQEYPWIHRQSISASSRAGAPAHEGAEWIGTF